MNKKGICLCIGILMVLQLGVGCAASGPSEIQETIESYAVSETRQTEAAEPESTETSPAVPQALRGSILDRNGEILVSSRACRDLVLDSMKISTAEELNEQLLRLYHECTELGLPLRDRLPISVTEPYTYLESAEADSRQQAFDAYRKVQELPPQPTAQAVVDQLRAHYWLPEDWSSEEARAVIGMRYLLDSSDSADCVIVQDISDDALSAIEALNIPGLTAADSAVRQYHTQYAAQMLGRLDGNTGASGMEAAFDDYLRAGDSVETTLDLGLQQIAENALAKRMQELQNPATYPENADGEDAEGAAVVVMKVKTGKVLACASYPSFDPATADQEMEALRTDPRNPLCNRALEACYAPGTLYLPCTLIAAMENNLLAYQETLETKGVFDKYPGFNPACPLAISVHGATHGTIDGSKALEVACNYFFYELGDRLTIDNIDDTAKALGLGVHTGIQLTEEIGTRANPDTKAQNYVGLNATWFVGDRILAVIGQSENRFTPLQLAVYGSTLANKGTRCQATVLNRVLSPDGQELLPEQPPKTIRSKLEISQETYETYMTGMKNAVHGPDGTARNYFGGADDPNPFPVTVCAATGSPQHAGSGSDNGAFLCFAPMEDPQITVAVYGEKAGQGSWLAPVAQEILAAYFAPSNSPSSESAQK